MKIKMRNYLLVFVFTFCFTGLLMGQSKFEYGLGIGINHSKINQDIDTPIGIGNQNNNGLRLPVLMTRIGYKFNDRFHLNSGPGVSWLGSLNNQLKDRMIAMTLELPLMIEWNLSKYIQLSSGPVYNFIVGIGLESDQVNFNRLSLVDTRHQAGLRHGIAFSYENIELFVNYSYYLTDVFNVRFTDVFGNFIGTSVSKFQNIQIGVIYRR